MFVLILKVAGKLTKDMVTQTSNLGVREAEAGGFLIQGNFDLHIKT